MKQNLQSGLWHRCGTCGTIFMSIQELSRHMATHKNKRFVQRRRNIPPRETAAAAPPLQQENVTNLTGDHV